MATLDAADAQRADLLCVNAMACARAVETDPAIMGACAHLLAVARAGRCGRARRPVRACTPAGAGVRAGGMVSWAGR